MAQTASVVSRIDGKEIVRSLVEVNDNFKQEEERILDVIQSSGALLKGHFEFGSGRHSEIMLRSADLRSRYSDLEYFANLLLSQLSQYKIRFDGVLTPDNAGSLAAGIHFLAKKKLIYVRTDEYAQPTTNLVNETDLYRNDKILLTGNLMSRGRSLRFLIDLVHQRKAAPVAVILFAIRDEELKGQFEEETSLKVFSIFRLLLENKTWLKPDCPLCKKEIPLLYSREI